MSFGNWNSGLDLGNDVIDHTKVDPLFGTEADLNELFDEIAKRGMHVIIDFIPNHTSEKSPWFNSSVNDRNGPFGDFYIWRDPLIDKSGNNMPPNGWVSEPPFEIEAKLSPIPNIRIPFQEGIIAYSRS